MEQLKPLSKESITKALTRAKHYRLLNEPWQAESICRDILHIEPENETALLYLVLAITDQFGTDKSNTYSETKELCSKFKGEYERNYYRGIVEERMGKEALKRKTHRAKYIAYEYYRKAMNFFEKAEKLHPPGNEDSVLRWNACVRRIDEFNLSAAPDENEIPSFLE